MMGKLKYIDIAKGILILLVIFLHVGYFLISSTIGAKNFFFHKLLTISDISFVPFFMAAFFIIHGFCSKTKRTFIETFEYGCKTLIIPCFFLNLWHNHWFVVAMLGAMLIHCALRNLPDKINWILYSFIFLGGIALNTLGITYFDIPYILAYAPFLFIGEKVPAIITNNKLGIVSLFIYISSAALFFISWHTNLPFITGGNFMVSFYNFPFFIIAAITGSSVIFMVSRLLEKVKWGIVDLIANFGKQSLVIYLFHFTLIIFIEQQCMSFLNNASIAVSAVAFVAIFLASLFGSYAVALLIKRYVPWLVGRKQFAM